MSRILQGILQQKLAEIQSQLPPYVKITKDNPVSFDEMLNNEIDTTETTSPDDIGNVNSIPTNGDYDSLVNAAARKYNVNSNVIKAVIKAESGFNPNAKSPVGAMGLMQLMPGTADSLGVKDAYDPAQNIDGGVRFLKEMLNEFGGNLEYALAAYNAGPGAVKKYGGIPPYDETQNYVKKIMSYLKTNPKK